MWRNGSERGERGREEINICFFLIGNHGSDNQFCFYVDDAACDSRVFLSAGTEWLRICFR